MPADDMLDRENLADREPIALPANTVQRLRQLHGEALGIERQLEAKRREVQAVVQTLTDVLTLKGDYSVDLTTGFLIPTDGQAPQVLTMPNRQQRRAAKK